LDKKRILQVSAHEELITSYHRNFSDKTIVLDYVLRKGGIDFKFSNDTNFSGKLFYITPIQISTLKWILELRCIIKKEGYKVIHLHLGWSNIYGIIACLGLEVKIICHVHSSYDASNIFKKLLRIPIKFIINTYSWRRLACSQVAASQIYNKDSIILKNAIEYSDFIFNPDCRDNLRLELGLDNKLVFCHVGNFYYPKNHLFLIKVYNHLLGIYPNSCLILVGDDYGLKNESLKAASLLNIKDKILFLGARKDISSILSASDFFLFPSFFEGLPLSLIEAQVSGLPCICSNTITEEAIISDFCFKLGISDIDINSWVSAVQKIQSIEISSRIYRSNSVPQSYNVSNVAHELESIYISAFN